MIGRRRRDPVTPELHAAILERDGWCLAAKLDPEHGCRDTFGTPHHPADTSKLQLDHVQDGYGKSSKRAKSDPLHLVAVCAWAHLGGWSTSKVNRERARAYLARVNQ